MSTDNTTICVSSSSGLAPGVVVVIEGRRFRVARVDSPTCMTITRYRWYHALRDLAMKQWRRVWQWVRG